MTVKELKKVINYFLSICTETVFFYLKSRNHIEIEKIIYRRNVDHFSAL